MEKDTIWVVTGENVATRGGGMKQLKVEKLALNVNLFIEQMGSILEKHRRRWENSILMSLRCLPRLRGKDR